MRTPVACEPAGETDRAGGACGPAGGSSWLRSVARFGIVTAFAGLALALARPGAAQPVGATAAGPAPTGPAATAPRLPAEAFFREPQVLQALLSPSGAKLAVTTARGAQRVSLVVFDLLRGGPPLRAAQFADVDISRVEWLGEDRLVFSVIDLQAGSGDDQFVGPGLYAVGADGAGLQPLVLRRSQLIVAGTPLSRRALPPNHVLLAVPPPAAGQPAEEVLLGSLRRNGGFVEMSPVWLNVRSLRTRHVELGDAPTGVVRWLIDPLGIPRVAVSVDGQRQRVHWRGPGSDRWDLLDDSPMLDPRFRPEHVDGAGQLFVTRLEGPQQRASLTRFDFAARAPAAEPWLAVDGFDFSGSVLTGDPGQPAVGVRVEADVETTVWVDAAMKRFQEQVDARLPGRINRVTCRRCTAEDGVALVHSFADRDPGQLWVVRGGGRWQLLSAILDGVDPKQMASVDLQRIRARDGRELPVWLTVPAHAAPGRALPAVVLVHGGPWTRGGHWRWNPLEQFLASRGYLVIAPEFRGSRGYGDAHFRAGWKQWGQAMQDDVADALTWAREQGLADGRACIAGGSYGGYAALMGLIRHPSLYRCGVAWLAVTDLELMLAGSWFVRDDTSDWVRQHSLPQLVGDLARDAEQLKAASVLGQASSIQAPVLLAYGERDLRVPIEHGTRLREAMRKAGREPEWLSYADEAHGWRKLETQIDFARRVEAFLERHLGPKAEAKGLPPLASRPPS